MPVEQSAGIKDVVIVALPAVVPALLAAVGFMVKEWREDRDVEHRRDEALARAERELAFWHKWRDAALDAGADSAESGVTRQMREVCARLQRDVDQSLARYEKAAEERGHNFFPDLLLLGHNASPGIWVARLLYYSCTAFAALCICVGFSTPPTGDAANNSWIFNALVNTFVVVVVLIPSFILWRLTRAMQRRIRRADSPPRHMTHAQLGPQQPVFVDLRGARTEEPSERQEDHQPLWSAQTTFRAGPNPK